MPCSEFEGKRPQVDPTAFIAPTATLNGDVRVEARASIWYGAELRADLAPIIIREGANVQDTQAEEWVKINPGYYAELGRRHREGITEIGSATD